MEVTGKTVFITGGGGGIGTGMAEAFAERGAKVVVADTNVARAGETAAGLAGGDAMAVELDVTALDSWAAARDAALARFGQVDILCNNAGVSITWQLLSDTPPEEFERLMRTNLFGVYYGVKTFVPDMIARGYGHVCNTSSVNGLVTLGMMGPYAASKFAVRGLTDALRDELAPLGIGVSALYPGFTRSYMSAATDALNKTGVKRSTANPMEPVWLGRAVVAAVEKGTPHIISHPAHKDAIAARFQEVLDCFGEPAQPGYAG